MSLDDNLELRHGKRLAGMQAGSLELIDDGKWIVIAIGHQQIAAAERRYAEAQRLADLATASQIDQCSAEGGESLSGIL